MLSKWWWSSGAEANGGGFQLGNSLRFRGGQRLSRVMAQNNLRVNTISFWFKRGTLGAAQTVFLMDDGANNIPLDLLATDRINIINGSTGFQSTSVYRDTGAWYHFCINANTMWINGEVVTTGDLMGSYGNSDDVFIGCYGVNNSNFFDGYIADVYLLANQTLQPEAFGEQLATGQWVPRETNFTSEQYGAGGFHLDFHDPDNLGEDVAPTGTGHTAANNFTPNGFNTNPVGLFTNMLAGSAPGAYQANAANRTLALTSPGQCFDGNLFTQVQVGNTADPNDRGGWLYFNPNFTGVTGLMFGCNGAATPTDVRINGQTVTFTTGNSGPSNVFGDNWCIVTGIPADGVVNELAFTSAGASTNTQTNGILLNGNTADQLLEDNLGTDFDSMQDSPTQNFATLNPNQSNQGIGSGAIPFVAPEDGNLQIPSNSNATPNVRYESFQVGRNQAFRFESFNPQPTVGVGNPAALALVNADTNANRNVIGGAGDVGNPPCNTAWYVDVPNRATYGWDIDTGAWINGSTGVTNANINGGNTQAILNWNTLAQSDWYVVMPDGNQGGVNTSANIYNFGQQGFQSPDVEGFTALQTQNLPAATIRDGREHFRAITGPGQGSGATPGANQTAGNFSKDVYGNNNTNYDPNTADKIFLSNTLGADKMFDGVLSDDAEVCKSGTGSAQTWIYWRPDPEIENVTTLAINCSQTQTVRINGGAPTGQTNAGIGNITIANPPATITEIAIQGNGTSSATIGGIIINGNTLVDFNILTQAQNTYNNGLYWIKDRRNTNHHQLVDTVRGNNLALWADDDDAEQNYAAPAGNSVAWCWNCPDTWASTDADVTAGTLASNGRRNAAAGFSIVSYQGNQQPGATVAHGLRDGNGAATPDLIIIKNRSTNADEWQVRHRNLGGNEWSLRLNASAVRANFNAWNNTAPNDNHIVLGPVTGTNGNGNNMIAYCWTAIPGYSDFGTYQGNGNSQGTMVITGFRPALVICKTMVTTNGGWQIYDSTRRENNPNNATLVADGDPVEVTASNDIDFYCNGFKLRNTEISNTAVTYVYMAWAEMPFGGSNTSPANAR